MTAPRQSDRAFGLTFACMFAAIWAIGRFAFGHAFMWPLVVAGIFLAVSLTVPGTLLPLNRLWYLIVGRLGRISNLVVLGIFFYGCILPFGMLLRLLGRDPMQRHRDAGAKTYWCPVRRHAGKDTYSDMF